MPGLYDSPKGRLISEIANHVDKIYCLFEVAINSNSSDSVAVVLTWVSNC
jgi:hypothetical protein